MKGIFNTSVIIFLFACIAIDYGYAQSDESYYDIQLSESNYMMLQRAAGEKGVTADDVAQWMAQNAMINVKASNEQVRSRLTVLMLDENGRVVGESSMRANVSSSAVPLGRAVNSSELSRTIQNSFPGDSYFPGDSFFPGDMFFPSDIFFPGDHFITSMAEAKRMASNVSQRVMSQVKSIDKSTPKLMVCIVAPDGDRFESAKPAAVALVLF